MFEKKLNNFADQITCKQQQEYKHLKVHENTLQ